MPRILGISVPSLLIIAMMLACGSPSPSADASEPTRDAVPTFTPAPTDTPLGPTAEPTPESRPAVDVAPTLPARSSTTEIILIPTATSIPEQPAQIVEPTAVPLTVTPIPTEIPRGATALDVANLRAGPSTEFPIVGSTVAGQSLTIAGRNPAGDWYQLSDGSWIAAFLVVDAPGDITVVDAPVIDQPVVASVAEQPVAESVPPTSQPFACSGGCAEPPDPSCQIKGNFNGNGGDKIFHQPGGRWYDNTDVVPSEGDVWFCTAEEARAAGYREAGK